MRRDLCFYSPSLAVEPADDVDRARWLKKRVAECRFYPTRICIDGTDHYFKHRRVKAQDDTPHMEVASVESHESNLMPGQWLPAFWSLTPDFAARPPLGVPNQHMEAVADMDPADGPAGTVLLRVRRSGRVDSAPNADKRPQPDEFRFWIDPAREHLVMRYDMVGHSSYIVESVAQSPTGHWYPTRVRRSSAGKDRKDQIVEFYMDFEVNLPDSLFDVSEPLPVVKLSGTANRPTPP